MAAKLLIPRKTSKGIQIIKKIKLTLLSPHDRLLNFRENIGISDTSNHEDRQTSIKDRQDGSFRKSASHVRLPPKSPKTKHWQEQEGRQKSLSAGYHY